MKDTIDAVRRAFLQLSAGEAIIPERTQIDVPEVKGTTLIMPGYLAKDKKMAIKVVSVFPQNHALGLPTIHAVVVVVDVQTGIPVCVLDGTLLTAMRTGAATGVATQLLSRDDAKNAAIFGAGLQAQTQLEAVCAVRKIKKARVFDLDPKLAEEYANLMEERLSIPVTVSTDPNKTAASGDIICTATTAETPVFDDFSVRPGTHINAIGVFKPHMHEIPVDTVVRAKVYVDHLHSAMEEAGDILIPINRGLVGREHIRAELGQVASGQVSGRTSAEEITLFKAVGVAAQDVAAAALVMERASQMRLGTHVDL